ncbi:MAG: acyl-CoA dehydrogenase, partial [bacterium]|nr:acyl-CoA dehydrogenase [bacterium]
PNFSFDPIDLQTTAIKQNGSYILNGKKCFVPLAEQSGHILAAAALEGNNNLFIVARDNPGLTILKKEKNLGLYSLDSYEILLENCEVPAADRLGGDTGCDYEKIIRKTRIALSAIGTGVSRASFDYAKDYARERTQFGEAIGSRQAVAFMIAEMAYEVDSMRLLTWKAASALEAGKDAKRESYLAKLYAGEMTMKVTDFGV